jgi:AraC family transcriptional regulator
VPHDGQSSGRLPRRLGVEELDLSQPFVDVSPARGVTRRRIEWPGMYADIVQATTHERLDLRFRAPVHLLAVYERGARNAGHTSVDGLPRSSLRDVTRKLTFVPAGHDFYEWHDPRILPRIFYFYLDATALTSRLEPDAGGLHIAPRVFFEDASLRETALKLATAMQSQTCNSGLYLEALAAVLAHEVVRVNSRASEAPVRGGLAGWQQRIVTAYIEEHVAEQIPLAQLAQLARLSQFHFCRAFKRSLGVPPHRYHAMRRMERAKTLLAKPAPSVTEIGLAVGFGQTSSFTAAFRRATGVTPTDYHRSLG